MLFISAAGESFFQLLFALFVFVGVLAVTAFVTRWIAGYQKAKEQGRNLEIIEAIRLSNNKYIHIVRAGQDKYFVIALGKDQVTLLGTLTADELVEYDIDSADKLQSIDFKAMLEKLSKKEK